MYVYMKYCIILMYLVPIITALGAEYHLVFKTCEHGHM